MQQVIADRRSLHRIPELELHLPKTMEYLENSLKGLGCSLFSPIPGSLCAFFDFGKEDAIAFRADCDALPIPEKTGVPYASEHPGCMHACGHDGHMSIVLELARRLSQKKALTHNVLLIFQPGEESPGGARLICETGVLEQYRIQAIFALHLWPGLTRGTLFSRKNEMMAQASEITVEFFGRSSHIANAGMGLDATAAMMAFYTKARTLERSLPEDIYRLLNFGKAQSGTARNAISSYARLEGSLRAFQDNIFACLREGLFGIRREIAETTGCAVEITLGEGYPAVINPESLFDRVSACVEFALLPEPSMTAEDFSCYQKQVPGMLFFLGTGDTPALHADTFDFDEEILLKGADFFEKLAENFQ